MTEATQCPSRLYLRPNERSDACGDRHRHRAPPHDARSRATLVAGRQVATFAAMIGRDPKWIAAQIGHVSPAFTFSVYQQVTTRRYVDEQAIWALIRFADEPAERAPSRQATRADGRDQAVEKGEFDRAIERLTDVAADVDDGGV